MQDSIPGTGSRQGKDLILGHKRKQIKGQAGIRSIHTQKWGEMQMGTHSGKGLEADQKNPPINY